ARITHGTDAALVGAGDEARPWTADCAGEFEHARGRPLRRVEPVLAQLVQFFRRCRDVDLLLLARLGERECLEASRRRVTKSALAFAHLRSLGACPDFVKMRMENAEEIIVVPRENDELMIGQRWIQQPNEQS